MSCFGSLQSVTELTDHSTTILTEEASKATGKLLQAAQVLLLPVPETVSPRARNSCSSAYFS